jgi:hypothetical protein
MIKRINQKIRRKTTRLTPRQVMSSAKELQTINSVKENLLAQMEKSSKEFSRRPTQS